MHGQYICRVFQPQAHVLSAQPTSQRGTALKSTSALLKKSLVKHKCLRKNAYYSCERHCETAANQVSLQVTQGTKPFESLKAQSLATSMSKAWA